jgi:RHH-type proline utilization regulon transcriptional repressor/proline dehydrogenase/delta 1-pyrroline-5-carboxylate dehydrogenase
MTNLDIVNIQDDSWLSLSLQQLNDNISSHYSIDEKQYVEQLYRLAYDDSESPQIKNVAETIIGTVRANDVSIFFDLEKLLQEYSLSDEDGVTLMCLAEALLRVPDSATVDALIQDKLSAGEWSRHFSKDNSLFVNASTWGLAVAGKLVDVSTSSITQVFKNSTKPVIRAAVDRAMRIMGQHFVLGRTVEEAMKNAKKYIKEGYDYSYDMLGESAITQADADRYYRSYMSALEKIAANTHDKKQQPSLSIKLSALHPRFEETHRDRVLLELADTVEKLVLKGIEKNVGITIDAEEADRMELTLALFELIYAKPYMRGWDKFGLVVQAYSKRALPALCWITKLAKDYGDEIPIRLVKGAYWDSEIQHSQEMGLSDYPVFTRKEYTDTAYLACARYLLSEVTRGAIYPQFASHNAHTVSSIRVMSKVGRDFEFQRLHGMGDDLYNSVLKTTKNIRVRIYAPVGSHEDLLPYLVRRLLENGANSSFVHQLSDERTDIAELIKRPLTLEQNKVPEVRNPLVTPLHIFKGRKNSTGINLASSATRQQFLEDVAQYRNNKWSAMPIIDGQKITAGNTKKVVSPFDNKISVGEYKEADQKLAVMAVDAAVKGLPRWAATPVQMRCDILESLAEKLESNRAELIALCQREAGKTIQDAIDEVREAVDFCLYYAEQAKKNFMTPITLEGPTGESNQLHFEAKGVFVCISPWNYPLAIFTGQVVAALVAGNTVIAKPAETTSLVAYKVVELLFEAGLPDSALQFLPGPGGILGGALNSDNRVGGVVFTGSNTTARIINQTLAARDEHAPIATLIAETGGLNAMIVDSTALPEQVAQDVVNSAFGAAGQRCSALRILYIQEDIAQRVLELVKGMMQELTLGDPQLITTDIGPVIDKSAQKNLDAYIEQMQVKHKACFQVDLPRYCDGGTFVKPTLFEVDSIAALKTEQFGPILHVVRFKAKDLDRVVSDINDKGYGLTLGVHTRNKTLYEKIASAVNVGNVYVNRNQVGAVVGVNPFGGRGLSGTGPKAGGPHYLLRFATEKTISNNLSAIGGNVELLNSSSS